MYGTCVEKWDCSLPRNTGWGLWPPRPWSVRKISILHISKLTECSLKELTLHTLCRLLYLVLLPSTRIFILLLKYKYVNNILFIITTYLEQNIEFKGWIHNQKSMLFPLFRKSSSQPFCVTFSYFSFRFQFSCHLIKVAFHDSTLITKNGVRSQNPILLLMYCISIAYWS